MKLMQEAGAYHDMLSRGEDWKQGTMQISFTLYNRLTVITHNIVYISILPPALQTALLPDPPLQ